MCLLVTDAALVASGQQRYDEERDGACQGMDQGCFGYTFGTDEVACLIHSTRWQHARLGTYCNAETESVRKTVELCGRLSPWFQLVHATTL
jgi:hypothetical protein